MKYYSHSLPGRPKEEWQPLVEHLKNVGRMAGEFARPFGAEEWANAVGMLHDIKKIGGLYG